VTPPEGKGGLATRGRQQSRSNGFRNPAKKNMVGRKSPPLPEHKRGDRQKKTRIKRKHSLVAGEAFQNGPAFTGVDQPEKAKSD